MQLCQHGCSSIWNGVPTKNLPTRSAATNKNSKWPNTRMMRLHKMTQLSNNSQVKKMQSSSSWPVSNPRHAEACQIDCGPLRTFSSQPRPPTEALSSSGASPIWKTFSCPPQEAFIGQFHGTCTGMLTSFQALVSLGKRLAKCARMSGKKRSKNSKAGRKWFVRLHMEIRTMR